MSLPPIVTPSLDASLTLLGIDAEITTNYTIIVTGIKYRKIMEI